MAAARLNLPSVFLYGGSILPGRLRDRALDIVSVFEAVGAHAVDALSDDELSADRAQRLPDRGLVRRDVHRQHDGVGRPRRSGMSLPGSSSPPAVDRRRDDLAYESGRAVIELLKAGIRPRQIMTKEAFENAIAVVMALGRLDQRGAPPAGDRQRGPRRARARRLQPRRRPRAAPRRHEAARQVPHGRPRPHRRCPGRDARAARRRPAARRLPHRDRADDGREPRRPRPAGARRHRRPPAHRPDPRAGGHRHPVRVARPEGRGRQDGRHRRTALRRDRAGLRRRGGGDGRHPGRDHRAGDRPRHPLRGAEGRSRGCARCSPSPGR